MTVGKVDAVHRTFQHASGAKSTKIELVAKYELTKTIEAVKLNPRTMRPVGPQRSTIPFGGILEKMIQDRDVRKFYYLGEPYQCAEMDINTALHELP